MSTTQTGHEPSPDQLAGTASDRGHQPGDVPAEAHGSSDHGDDHGHDDHAHGGEALGPVDARAWGALALGVAAGLVIALILVISTALAGTTPAL